MNGRSRGALIPIVLMILLVTTGPSGGASDDDARDDVDGDTVDLLSIPAPPWGVDPLDTDGDPNATMGYIMERTFLKVDAVKVEMRVDEETARTVGEIVRGQEKYTNDLSDSLSTVLLETGNADIDLEFLVSFSLKKFLKGSKKNIEEVARAGLLTKEEADSIQAEQPARFAFLTERGMKDGDRMFYRVRGDTLHMRFVYREGGLGLEETNVGPERRVSLLGAYVGPRSDFRKGLIKSLFEE